MKTVPVLARVLVAVAAFLIPASSQAQSAKVTKVVLTAPAPRLANGKPDFSGNWTRPAARDMTESFTNPNGSSTKPAAVTDRPSISTWTTLYSGPKFRSRSR